MISARRETPENRPKGKGAPTSRHETTPDLDFLVPSPSVPVSRPDP